MSAGPGPRDDARMAYFDERHRRLPRMLARFGTPPLFHGRRVLDIGCGLGPLSIHAGQQGATAVLGVDPDAAEIEAARQILDRAYPHLRGRLRFESRDAADLREETFDTVVSLAVFEHVLDPPAVLRSIARLMAEGGKAYLGIGPLYRAPWGDHRRLQAPAHRFFPWAHLCFPEAWLIERRNRDNVTGAGSIEELGLNGLRLEDYLRAFRESGLAVERLVVNAHEAPGVTTLLNALRRLPGLGDLLAVNLYVTLAKA